MYFLSSITEDIVQGVHSALRTLLASICSTIYELIAKMYNLFMEIAKIDLLSLSTIDLIYERIALLLGLFMLFKLIFSFLQMLVNPDLITDKEKGVSNIIVKILIVVVLLGSVPSIFKMAIRFQNLIISESVIEKVILQKDTTNNTVKAAGNNLSANLFEEFYYLEPATNETGEEDKFICENDAGTGDEEMPAFWNAVRSEGSYSLINNCLTEVGTGTIDGIEQNIFVVHFDGWTAIFVGIFVLWILLMYCISIGTRVIQLAFLQLIAPIPIISYLMPGKNGTFQKWVKQCVITYVDLFIRIAIISFIILMVDIVFNQINVDGNKFVQLFLVLGLLFFGKKAPELLKELFPSGGAAGSSFGIKSPSELAKSIPGLGVAKRGVGAGLGFAAGGAVGLAGGLARGEGFKGKLKSGTSGLFGGATRGLIGGAKKGGLASNTSGVIKNQSAVNANAAKIQDEGGSYWGSQMANLQGKLGIATTADKQDKLSTRYKSITEASKQATDLAKAEANKHGVNYKVKLTDENGHVVDTNLADLEKLATNQNLSAHDQAKYQRAYNSVLAEAANTIKNQGIVTNGEVNINYNENDGKSNYDSTSAGATIEQNAEINAAINKVQTLVSETPTISATGTTASEIIKNANRQATDLNVELVNSREWDTAHANKNRGNSG